MSSKSYRKTLYKRENTQTLSKHSIYCHRVIYERENHVFRASLRITLLRFIHERYFRTFDESKHTKCNVFIFYVTTNHFNSKNSVLFRFGEDSNRVQNVNKW